MNFWRDEPWAKDPAVLIDILENLYRQAMRLGKVTRPALTTMKKVMAQRRWCMAVPLDQLLTAVENIELVYVPAGVGPGPAFAFAIRDVSGDIKRLHLRLHDPEVYGMRYLSIMVKDSFVGPAWIGADETTLAKIIQTGSVLVVEGPFDLLAVRTVAPEIPSLSPLSKRLTRQHVAYLSMLGVDRINVMWDEDQAGDKATRTTVQKLKSQFTVTPVECPGPDPAECLCSVRGMYGLNAVLHSLRPCEAVPWDEI